MAHNLETERIETVIVGGGQAGLATGYHLQRRSRPFVILDSEARLGDSWRKRWDSLRLFTPAKLSSLPGMKCPGAAWSFPTKDEFGHYLEAYADRFQMHVVTGARVSAIVRDGNRYIVTAGDRRFEAEHVVLATGAYQEPRVPVFAPELDGRIVQLHSSVYRSPSQLRPGAVLVAGAGNSGAEIALELAGAHEVWLAGSKVPVFPVRAGSIPSRVVMPAFLFAAMHILTTSTPIGRRMRPKARVHAAPLIRVKPSDLRAAGIRRVGRVVGVEGGQPRLDDGTTLDVANVVWCTGFRSDFSWLELPAFADGDEPAHVRGVVTDEPGLYLAGQRFQFALASSFIAGAGRDADHIAGVIARRVGERQTEPEPLQQGEPAGARSGVNR